MIYKKKLLFLVVFFLAFFLPAESRAADLFIGPGGADIAGPSPGFSLTYGPTDYSADFEGQISNFPVGESGIIGAFVFAGGREICIGFADIDASKSYKMRIYGDDPATPEIEGAKEGSFITFKAIIRGEVAPLVPIAGTAPPIWKDNQIVFTDLNIEKAGLEGILSDMVPEGRGLFGAGGLPTTNLGADSMPASRGGFGVPTGIDPQDPEVPPVIPEPASVVFFGTALTGIIKRFFRERKLKKKSA